MKKRKRKDKGGYKDLVKRIILIKFSRIFDFGTDKMANIIL